MTYSIASIEASEQKIEGYNGMIILSAHGNLAGDVVVGKRVDATNFGKQINEMLTKKGLLPPKWIVLLACGVGQERTFAEELAQQRKAVVFASKFVISRTGSKPQMEWDYAATASTTSWSMSDIPYDGVGEQLPMGALLCKKLRMRFTPLDEGKITDAKK
eukprot:11209965-Lingulodinium_polyedra.AAC.1